LALILLGGVVRADDNRAQELSAEGMAHFNAGRYRQAIEAFRASHNTRPLPLLLFNIAQAHRLGGDCGEAMVFYRRYLDAAPTAANRPLVEKLISDCAAVAPIAPAPEPEPVPEQSEPEPEKPPPPVIAPVVIAPVVPPPPPRKPLYHRWWLWTAVGATAAIALGVGLGVGLSNGPPSPSLGTVTWQ
jgi:hypothetical protein